MADDLHESYRILQLEPGASLPAVKKAYRQLVKTWHPDHFAPGSAMEVKAQEKLKAINQAYEELCKKRGVNPSSDADQGEAKKARKPAASSDEEAGKHHSQSRKAEEEPASEPGQSHRGRKVSDFDEEPGATRSRPPRAAASGMAREPFRRRLTKFLRDRRTRRGLIWGGGGAAVLVLAVRLQLFSGWEARLEAWMNRPARGTTAPAPPAALAASASTPPASAPEVPQTPDSGTPAPALVASAAAPSLSASPPQPPAETPKENSAAAAGGASSLAAAPGPSASPAVSAPVADAPLGSGIKASVPLGSVPSVGIAGSARSPSLGAGAVSTVAPAPAAGEDKNFDTFTVGSSKDEVFAIQGKPDSFTDTAFQYGSSHVFFKEGKVVSWEEGSTKLKARLVVDLAALGIDYFTVGSRKDEVFKIQGKPDRYTDTAYQYGTSAVFFREGRVVSWIDGTPHLKARQLPSVAREKLAAFTVGSRKDEVVMVQGLPDSTTDTTFVYGTSTVYFVDGKVATWVSAKPPLKAKAP